MRLRLARKNDPMSSHLAAAKIPKGVEVSTRVRLMVQLVNTYPGHTSRELGVLARKLGHEAIDRHEAARRLSDARKLGLIDQGPMRHCSASDNKLPCVTWIKRRRSKARRWH